ncbi:SDR family oxidoreductase [Arthrobacter zhangbolii]|uniref:SDR family oxidoreductase n=1 Tax=Arthrobacter zhangbolii TaxID=2886936 RepID=A0A9X1M9G7_9MICC|nr:SDR family NAD(P)-dependent oxidoreductase [Arthrobacter zhangbolii]MCC3273240.1 SDR family oxidoreductase [Arthrobacter zhangbolii]UON92773.1 SDR family oxidoreductase [Arthrobacter zhangbolii]
MSSLRGKTAVITGAGSGIGAAIARLFAAEGADLALLDLDEAGAGAVAAECTALGVKATARRVDVTDSEDMRAAMDAAAGELGGLDILVSSAGILDETPFLELSPETFDRTLDVDLRGVFLAARWAAPHMVERGGGRIINISSQLGIKGGTGLAHYVSAKAGVIGLTKALALELAPHSILVNAIAPGPIFTPLIDGLSEDWKTAKQAELPVGRFGTAEEVAPTALLLASSPGGNLYTGQTLGPNSGDVMP